MKISFGFHSIQRYFYQYNRKPYGLPDRPVTSFVTAYVFQMCDYHHYLGENFFCLLACLKYLGLILWLPTKSSFVYFKSFVCQLLFGEGLLNELLKLVVATYFSNINNYLCLTTSGSLTLSYSIFHFSDSVFELKIEMLQFVHLYHTKIYSCNLVKKLQQYHLSCWMGIYLYEMKHTKGYRKEIPNSCCFSLLKERYTWSKILRSDNFLQVKWVSFNLFS